MMLLGEYSVWTWGHFFFGLTYAITASLIFLFIVLLLFKPKIRICSFLCKYTTAGNPPIYIFKFINLSYFPAHEIRVELHKIRKIPMGSGKFNNEYHKLTLLNGEISHIPARVPFWNKNAANPHCVTVRSKENINNILSDDSNAIILKVSLKHGLTGLSKVFEHEYAQEQAIKIGKFKPGTQFAVL